MGRRQPAPADLLDRAKAGDAMALDRLFARELPPLRHWAAGRLPAWARDIADTTDLVQETMVQALKHLHRFEYRGEGALQAYLRQAVMNRVRNEIRSRLARGLHVPVDANIHDQGTSPLDAAVMAQMLERYDRGLERLQPEEREAVIARIELGMSYRDIAIAQNRPSPNAARMLIVRALGRLAQAMRPD